MKKTSCPDVRSALSTFLRFGRRMNLPVCLLACLMAAGTVRAGMVLTNGLPFAPAEDKILIYYDSATKTETVIFAPSVRFRGEDIVWLMPLPSEARSEVVGRQVFRRLADYTAPVRQITIHRVWKIDSLLRMLWTRLFTKKTSESSAPPAPLDAPPGKIVVSRRDGYGGPYPVVTESEEKFLESVKAGFGKKDVVLPLGFIEWARPYLKAKAHWVAVAARADRIDLDSKMDEQIGILPFRVTFQTDRPIVPLITPVSEAPRDWPTGQVFRFFIAGSERAAVTLGGQPFFTDAQAVFADRVPVGDWKEKILTRGRPELPVAGDLFLTAYSKIVPTPVAFTENPTVEASANRTTYRPPNEIVVTPQALVIPVEALVLVLGGGWLAWRQRKRSAR